jgi:deazaflavin-dependent oxidoreductase (nitroreductase family)
MAPWLAYRFGLGWLLGHRVVLLEHRGRTTGRPVRTVLHVVRWDPAARHVLIAVGSGPGTDWYRNVLAHPLVRVTIGRERNVLGCAVPLPDDEARSGPAVMIDLAPPRRRSHRSHRSHRSQRRPLAA